MVPLFVVDSGKSSDQRMAMKYSANLFRQLFQKLTKASRTEQ